MSIIFNLLVSDNLEWSHNSRFEIGTQRPRLFFCFSFFFLRQAAFAESPQVFPSTLSRPCSPFEREIIELTHFYVGYRLIHLNMKRCFIFRLIKSTNQAYLRCNVPKGAFILYDVRFLGR